MICGLRIKRNGGDRSLPMVTPDGVIWPIGEVALLLSGALYAQNGASRQLEQLFLSFCPRLTLSCPISDLFPRKTGQGRSNEIFVSRNIDIQYHIICSTDPPVG